MREAAVLALALLLAAVPPAVAGEPVPARQQELMNLLRHDCGACHGLTLKGGLGPPLRPEALAGRKEAELVEIILEGVPDTPMPPWSIELDREEAAWLVRRLQAGLDDAQ